MSSVDWVPAVAHEARRPGPNRFRDWLAAVVAETHAGLAEPTEAQQAAHIAPYAVWHTLYSAQESASEAGRKARDDYGPFFGGNFLFFTKHDDNRAGWRLHVRFIPKEIENG